MSGTVDVGDAIQLTFTTTTGANVTLTWTDPTGAVAIANQAVPENPPGSGSFPATLVPSSAGVWEALFTASGAATAVERYYVRAVALTGPPPLATVDEVKAQFGSMTKDQETLTGTLLRAASKRVRARFLAIDTQLAKGLLDPEVVALGVVAMVLRVLRNPQGLKGESVGPFSRTYDTSVAAGLLVIGKDEELMFKPSPWRFPIAKTIVARPGLATYPVGIHPEISSYPMPDDDCGGYADPDGDAPAPFIGEEGMDRYYDPLADVPDFAAYPEPAPVDTDGDGD